MKIVPTSILICFVVTLVSLLSSVPLAVADSVSKKLSYPVTPKSDQVDFLHGVKVKDSYRWLEDSTSKATTKWIDSQNKFTREFLKTVKERPKIEGLLRKYWYYDNYSSPVQINGKLFYQMNNILYFQDSANSKPKELVDPNKLSGDGTIALSTYSVSYDGKYLAYLLTIAGSDWQEWRVRDISTGKDTGDRLKWIQYSAASWTKDNKGFFYSRYDKPKLDNQKQSRYYFHKLYYHRLGTKQSEDKLVFQSVENKEWGFCGMVTSDGNYLVIHIWDGHKPSNRIYYKDLSKKNSKVVKLLDRADARYNFVNSDGGVFWFKTDLNAPKGRFVEIDIAKSVEGKLAIREIVPEKEDVLVYVTAAGGHFFCHYLKDVHTKIVEYTASGARIGSVKLPGIGTVEGFNGGESDSWAYYTFASFNSPAELYRFNLGARKSELFFRSRTSFNRNEFVVKQFFVKGRDGVRVPLFVTYKKGMKRDGKNPTFLYSYGGFNQSMIPAFSAPMLAWMDLGGIYAQACLRGGGEYGEDWHKGGMLANKQNVFDDLLLCSRWLVRKGYTSEKKLAIGGHSNGALAVGACMIQHPELFGATCMSSGVFDMLRFQNSTIGWSWVSEYGSSDVEDQFKYLFAYSPLHNIEEGTAYPPTFISTSTNDDRVVPSHSYKFCAALQNAQSGSNPILIRVETNTGHGSGKPVSRLVEEWTDKLCFLYTALKFKHFQFSN